MASAAKQKTAGNQNSTLPKKLGKEKDLNKKKPGITKKNTPAIITEVRPLLRVMAESVCFIVFIICKPRLV